MSKTQQLTEFKDPSDVESWMEDKHDEIEREANSDGPHAWVFQRMLQSLEEDSS